MSLLTYNGITLQLIKTNSIERIVRLSEDKTEYAWTDFIIDINCIYNPAATSYTSAGQSYGNLPMTTDTAIRGALLQPRWPLLFQEGGISILNVPSNLSNGGAIDCDNGPTPQSINIQRIGSSRIFFINYVIKASIIECPVGGTIAPVASSRYGRTESLDEDFLSTLTTSGITLFRANVLTLLGNNADFYRSYIIPQPLYGYKRTSVSFSLDSGGNICRWSTVDVEQKQELGSLATSGSAASVGITKMGLTYHAGALQDGPMGMAGYGSIASVTCWAQGMRFMSTYSALQFIIAVAYNKIAEVSIIGFLSRGEISEDVFNNRVEVSLSFRVLDDDDGFPGLFIPMQNLVGIPLVTLPNTTGNNPQPIFSKGTRGTAAYMLAVSSFAYSCAGYNPFDPTGQIVDPTAYNPALPSGVGPAVTGFYDPGIPSPPSPLPSLRQKQKKQARSPGNQGQSMNNATPTKINLVGTQGIIQIPVAANVNTTSGSSPTPTPTSSSSSSTSTPTPTPSCVNIQLFQPTTKKVVEWYQERIGAVPEVPDPTVPDDYENNYTLLSNTVSTNSLEVMADAATLIYRVSGVYSYSLLNALPPGSQMQDGQYIEFSIPPWINLQPSDYTQLQPGDFESGIINT